MGKEGFLFMKAINKGIRYKPEHKAKSNRLLVLACDNQKQCIFQGQVKYGFIPIAIQTSQFLKILKRLSLRLSNKFLTEEIFNKYNIIISLARTPEIGQGQGRILSYGARKPEQTQMDL